MAQIHYITMGDPAGIGPEITVKAFCSPDFPKNHPAVVIGDLKRLESAAVICNLQDKIEFTQFNPGSVPKTGINIIPVLDMKNVPERGCPWGEVSAEGGKASFDYIKKASELVLTSGGSIVTTPINKESLKAAQVPFIGHTEILGGLTDIENPVTMFQTLGLRVFFLTRHVSLRQACDLVTEERLLSFYKECFKHMDNLGIKKPTLAVAGLNPHSGEHGLFGDEEVNHVEPSIKKAQAAGMDVVGPIGADSVFHQAKCGKYSAVVSLYHDQGHIATKTLDFERTISVTLGLPFLRTSVDHGTAFDIAGKGKASAVSLIEAVKVAEDYIN